MFFLFAMGAVIAVAVASGGGARVIRVSPKQAEHEPTISGYRQEHVAIPWSCKRADKQPVPPVPPAAASAALKAGPIAKAIVVMYGAMRQIFMQLGAKKTCTLGGSGRYVLLMTYPRTPERRVKVWIEPLYSYKKNGTPTTIVGGEWTFDSSPGKPTGSVEIPMVKTLGGDEQGPGHVLDNYLINGGRPPADLWKHYAGVEPDWLNPVTPEYDVPKVDLIRTENTLALYAWLPPRSSLYHLSGALLKRVFDAPVTWRINWYVTTE